MSELILYKDADGVSITDTQSMMELMMQAWDGVGLPDKEWVDVHFRPEVLNGILIFDPSIGMFTFSYTNALVKKTYDHMDRCLSELEEGIITQSQFCWQVGIHYNAGRIRKKEAQTLLMEGICRCQTLK